MPESESFNLDTHAMYKDFIAAGFTKKQAETQVRALSNLVNSNLATKLDIAAVSRDIESVRKDLTVEIANVSRDIEELRSATKKDIEVVRRDMKITMLVATLTILGAFKYFL